MREQMIARSVGKEEGVISLMGEQHQAGLLHHHLGQQIDLGPRQSTAQQNALERLCRKGSAINMKQTTKKAKIIWTQICNTRQTPDLCSKPCLEMLLQLGY